MEIQLQASRGLLNDEDHQKLLPKTPILLSRVTPFVLYSSNKTPKTAPQTQRKKSGFELVKVSNTYEYYFYLKRKKEYEEKQKEIIKPLQVIGVTDEDVEKITYSIKQVGVSDNNEGKFGIQSQRRYIQQKKNYPVLSSGQCEPQAQLNTQQYVSYKFKAKRLATSLKISTKFASLDLIPTYKNKRIIYNNQRPLVEIVKKKRNTSFYDTNVNQNCKNIYEKYKAQTIQNNPSYQPFKNETMNQFKSYSRLIQTLPQQYKGTSGLKDFNLELQTTQIINNMGTKKFSSDLMQYKSNQANPNYDVNPMFNIYKKIETKIYR